jgi:hypothetical protein
MANQIGFGNLSAFGVVRFDQAHNLWRAWGDELSRDFYP